jgi:hypothetical protein
MSDPKNLIEDTESGLNKPKVIIVEGIPLTNGEIPLENLISIKDNKKLYKPAAESFKKMMEEALKVGLDYRLNNAYRAIGTKNDYITYLTGKSSFTQYTAWDLYNKGKSDPSDPIYGKYAENPAAPPGTSNHGFGLAIDIRISDESKRVFRPNQDSLQKWITENGSYYGWFWVGRNFTPIEPWHFEYTIEADKTRIPPPVLVKNTPQQINKITQIQQTSIFDSKSVTKLIKACFINPFE